MNIDTSRESNIDLQFRVCLNGIMKVDDENVQLGQMTRSPDAQLWLFCLSRSFSWGAVVRWIHSTWLEFCCGTNWCRLNKLLLLLPLLYLRFWIGSANEHVLGVNLHVYLRVQLDLVGPFQDSCVDQNAAVEGVVLEVGMQVQLVAIWD